MMQQAYLQDDATTTSVRGDDCCCCPCKSRRSSSPSSPKQIRKPERFFIRLERAISFVILLLLLHSSSSFVLSAFSSWTKSSFHLESPHRYGYQQPFQLSQPQRYLKLSAYSLSVARLDGGDLYSPKNVSAALNGRSVPTSSEASADSTDDEDFDATLRQWNRTMSQKMYRNDYSDSIFQDLRSFFHWFEQHVVEQRKSAAANQNELQLRRSMQVDQMLQLWTNTAFCTPRSGSRHQNTPQSQVWWGYEVMQHQWTQSHAFLPPYNLVPKHTLLQALRALTSMSDMLHSENDEEKRSSYNPSITNWGRETSRANSHHSSADAAYRILQRLLTNVGVRTRHQQRPTIHECDFNAVLNAYVQIGQMDRVQCVVALQERTSHAPPLSAVTCSILLKGYGRLRQLDQIHQVVEMAQTRNIQPDVIMINSLLDAYVNCNALNEARNLMTAMTNDRHLQLGSFIPSLPRPNGRTYNIFLKGLANAGILEEAIQTAQQEMSSRGWWDAITTNTLVHAAIVAGNFTFAEQLLADYTTVPVSSTRATDHPNVEAYTELIDAYAKQSQLIPALSLFQIMRERGVEPNEITYTCMIAGFGRNKQLDQARKMITHMSTVAGIQPTCITYNALLSALVQSPNNNNNNTSKLMADSSREPLHQVRDADVDDALRLLRDMIQSGIRPNAVTAATLVSALGYCSVPRVQEAKVLVQTLERDNWIPIGNTKVTTSLMQTCGMGHDMVGATEAFRALKQIDTVAVNMFLDVCCRCGRDRMAFDTFEYYFRQNNASRSPTNARRGRPLPPDLISYSILISSLLKRPTISNSIRRAAFLYNDMKTKDSLYPDRTLIDMILKAAVRLGRSRTLTKDESCFVVGVLRDAQRLQWEHGQLERRKRAIQVVVGSKWRDLWLAVDSPLHNSKDNDDDLFQRKGWNQVDSGFKLWGYRSDDSPAEPKPKKVVDRFLESKGWNDVDSGFRII